MKVEYRYAAQPETQESPVRRLRVAVYYFYTGERVDPGRYVCTFCGHATTVTTARALPPCHICDSAEFAREVDAAA